jgi:cyclopropane fatty-acyl-phospholipid synthase-like methyltransferase
MLTDVFRENEVQALIVLAELADPVKNPNNNHYQPCPRNMEEARTYFRRFALNLSGAWVSLKNKGLVEEENNRLILTAAGKDSADEIRLLRPPIYYWYRDFYTAIENSPAFNEYSRRVFGKNLGQHDFSDISQIHRLLDILKLHKGSQALDIGCGNGKTAEYISDITQAPVTGIDYCPDAIAQAILRTQNKKDRLRFEISNLEMLRLAPQLFDAIISIDTIFFGREMKATLAGLKKLLKPGGQIAVFNGAYLREEFLAALRENSLSCITYDFSKEHIEHMKLKNRVGRELQKAFAAEGNEFIWKNIMAESFPESGPVNLEFNSAARYLYIVQTAPYR